eukprot:TRINITY_DN3189_c0_g1_i2.p1 TRINITY_DN3189_c0_g1~~TRINITY_DN3189_c0_g1_i2.p1  ORF type:complete len:218 (-),score=39.03 TRINITY_DN3189_c0_g1_i2:45-698(-)
MNLLNSDINLDTKHVILWSLGNICIDPETRNMLCEYPKNIDHLVELIKCNAFHIQIEVVNVLSIFLIDNDLGCEIVGEKGIKLLVALLEPNQPTDPKINACWAIARLTANHHEHREYIREVGGLQYLLVLLNESSTELKMAVLWAVCNCIKDNQKNSNVVTSLEFKEIIVCLRNKILRPIAAKIISILSVEASSNVDITDLILHSTESKYKINLSKN